MGKYIDIDMLGIYNIGYFLASFPLFLGGAITGRILIPLYTELPSILTRGNMGRIRLMRSGLTGGMLFLQFGMAFAGVALVGLLYDPRYSAAGPIAVVISLIQIPVIIGLTYDQAALAAGDSKNYFYTIAIRAVVQTTFFIIGAELAGLTGAMIGQGVATVMLHAVTIWLARKYNVWDPLHDAAYTILSIILSGAVLYFNQSSINSLF